MTDQRSGSATERRARETLGALTRATEAVAARLAAQLAAAGLTPSQFAVLEALHRRGSLCQVELSRTILKSSGNLTTVVDNLERSGLVERRRGPGDRRRVTVSLTPLGGERIADVLPRHARTVVEELAMLSPAEQVELTRLARKVERG